MTVGNRGNPGGFEDFLNDVACVEGVVEDDVVGGRVVVELILRCYKDVGVGSSVLGDGSL